MTTKEHLAGTPWSVRLARGQRAVEVYDAGTLIDVVVATRVAPQLLRGARRSARRDRPSAIAWGRLPSGPPALRVTFTRSLRRRAAYAAEVVEVGGFCWLAVAHGRFNGVTVGRLRMRTGR